MLDVKLKYFFNNSNYTKIEISYLSKYLCDTRINVIKKLNERTRHFNSQNVYYQNVRLYEVGT